MRQEQNTAHGPETALAGAYSDLLALAQQWISDQPTGRTFTAAQMSLYLPPYVDDKPCRRGALVRELSRRGYIEFAGYGARAADDDWDAPARVWRRTDVRVEGGAAA